jgi:hypothetical protein
MKLWLQVLFAQGYLWRGRFPQRFAEDAHLRGERPSLWQVIFGLFWLAAAFLVVRYDASLWALIYLTIGIGFSFPLLGILRIDRIFGSAALWVSLSWAFGVLALVGVLAMVVACALFGYWLGVFLFLAFLAFPAAPTLNGILSRYLFFADPHSNAHLLEDHSIYSARTFVLETYWRLPSEVVRAMFHRPKAAA